MKAVIFEDYGSPEVLQIKDVSKPEPKANEVRIRVFATTVTKYDCWVRSRTAPPGFGLMVQLTSGRKPKQPVLGTELSGEVETVGKGVTRFKAGDPVYGYAGMNLGAHAEYVCLPEEAVAPKPANLSYEEAAAVLQGALTALYFLQKGNIHPGDQVLVYGASGGVGNYAVQIARHYYKAEVTGVCSTEKRAFVESLGADRVVDYTQEDFAHNGQIYDLIFDTAGKTSVSRARRSLKANGSYLLATFGLPALLQLLWFSKTSRQSFAFGALKEKTEDLTFLKGLLETGVIHPVIDQCYPMDQVAEAHRYVESGQKMGNVVLQIQEQSVAAGRV